MQHTLLSAINFQQVIMSLLAAICNRMIIRSLNFKLRLKIIQLIFRVYNELTIFLPLVLHALVAGVDLLPSYINMHRFLGAFGMSRRPVPPGGGPLSLMPPFPLFTLLKKSMHIKLLRRANQQEQ